jgi:hypothetical protein
MELVDIIKIFAFWTVLHLVAANLYTNFCAHASWYGLLVSPFIAPAPHCRALRWIIYNGGSYLENVWMTLGTYCVAKISTASQR